MKWHFILITLLLITNVVSIDDADSMEIFEDFKDLRPSVGKIQMNTTQGNIEFVSDIKSFLNESNLLTGIHISQNRIEVDSEIYPDLNEPATVTFFDVNITSPIITRNGQWRQDIQLIKVNQTTYTFTTDYFSVWELHDKNWNGTFVNTTLFNNNIQIVGDAFLVLDAEQSPFIDRSYLTTPIPNNGVTQIATGGRYNSQAYYFDGVSADISLAPIPEFNLTSDTNWTIASFWNASGTGAIQSLINKRAAQGIIIQINAQGFVDFFTDHIAGNRNCVGTTNFTALSEIYNPLTISVVATYGSNNIKSLYINGVLDSQCDVSASGEMAWNNINLSIGANNGGSQFVTGAMDDLIMLNRSFNLSQVLDYNNTNNLPVYKTWDANYTGVPRNVTDFFPQSTDNAWQLLCLEGNTTNTTVYGRAGNCGSLGNVAWTQATKINSSCYLFVGVNGFCFEEKYEFLSQGNSTASISNVTIYSDYSVSAPIGGNGGGGSSPSFLSIFGDSNVSLFDDLGNVIAKKGFLERVYDYFSILSSKIRHSFNGEQINIVDDESTTIQEKEHKVIKFSLLTILSIFILIVCLILYTKQMLPWWAFILIALAFLLAWLLSSDTTALVLDKTNSGGLIRWN